MTDTDDILRRLSICYEGVPQTMRDAEALRDAIEEIQRLRVELEAAKSLATDRHGYPTREEVGALEDVVAIADAWTSKRELKRARAAVYKLRRLADSWPEGITGTTIERTPVTSENGHSRVCALEEQVAAITERLPSGSIVNHENLSSYVRRIGVLEGRLDALEGRRDRERIEADWRLWRAIDPDAADQWRSSWVEHD
jgi:hypothetical protein